MPCEFEGLGNTAMPWPVCAVLGKTSPCLTVEIIIINNNTHRGQWIQSLVRSLRDVARNKIKATDFIFLKPFQTPKISVKSLLMGISPRMTLSEKVWAGKAGCGVSSGGGS